MISSYLNFNNSNNNNNNDILQSLCGVVGSVWDYNIVVSEFELQSRYYVLFRTNTL